MRASITLTIQKTFDIPDVPGIDDEGYDEMKADAAVDKKVVEVSKPLEDDGWNVELEDSGEAEDDDEDEDEDEEDDEG